MDILLDTKDISTDTLLSLNENENFYIDSLVNKTKENAIKCLENYFVKLDDVLASKLCDKTKNHNVKIIKKVQKTLFTSIGEIKFKRRYYLNLTTQEYFYALDYLLRIKKYQRYSDELLIKLLVKATELTYSKVSNNVVEGFYLSKSTICRLVKKTKIKAADDFKITNSNDDKVHVQIDEKYVSIIDKKDNRKIKSKKRLITATIFKGTKNHKGRKKLLNRFILSSFSIEDISNKINQILKDAYKVNETDTIYFSGDLATYIQNFDKKIEVCDCIYVPDKFHIIRDLKSLFGLIPSIEDLLDKGYMDHVYYALKLSNQKDARVKKLLKLFKNGTKILQSYAKRDYRGCCQESMNSHYYCTRFGKLGYSFNKSTVEKLSLIKECYENNIKIQISLNLKEPTEPLIDRGIERMEIGKYDIDTTGMKAQTRKMFESIKYGSTIYW